MVSKVFQNCFWGKRVLITGNTGFKGSWLALWLQQLGAEVIGYALEPDTTPSHWELLNLNCRHYVDDIRNAASIERVVKEIKPDVIFHLAAQPLVRLSYEQPVVTWTTNVVGTVNLLNASRNIENLAGIVVVTTDKVYENPEHGIPFQEDEELGGSDPYSASKAACELVVQSFRKSFFNGQRTMVATARAGNVIGGGDWAKDRLIPDVVIASSNGEPVKIRYPNSIRPWQHVLDSLSGYLCLAQRMIAGDTSVEGAWNFGPDIAQQNSVSDVLIKMNALWPELVWDIEKEMQPHEAVLLQLNCEKARKHLNWSPIWLFDETAEKTASWYQRFYSNNEVITSEQIEQYQNDARKRGAYWAC